MTRETAALVMATVAALILALMLWGWRRRVRRDAGIVPPVGERRGLTRAVFAGFYVATTRHDAPLDRLTVRHLAHRSRVVVTVTEEGVTLDLPGEPTLFLDAARLAGVGRATWTIDRAVEPDGLVLVAWTADDGTICDTYIRLQDGDPDALVEEIARLHAGAAPDPRPSSPPAQDSTSTGDPQ
ncbi:PH-like domain-containing protein [Microbacterium album]|uniref:PH domain-containing protein n=1 Tax=Microbacterium album TaxID=2053191 RepID=A0A917IDV3_9MICO|nr:hypothetical protein [Microbacterium album]GGH35738.1 hypothetical protein GCM10010921_04370 [Microbacterium album]